MTSLDIYVTLLFVIKIVIILSTVMNLVVPNNAAISGVRAWSETVFIVGVSILLIYLFNPRFPHMQYIKHETAFLIFVYGVLMLIKENRLMA